MPPTPHLFFSWNSPQHFVRKLFVSAQEVTLGLFQKKIYPKTPAPLFLHSMWVMNQFIPTQNHRQCLEILNDIILHDIIRSASLSYFWHVTELMTFLYHHAQMELEIRRLNLWTFGFLQKMWLIFHTCNKFIVFTWEDLWNKLESGVCTIFCGTPLRVM